MGRTARGAPLVFAVILAVCSSASAQGPTSGSIFGSVTDATRAAVADVKVTCRSPAQMGVQTAVSNDHGRYRFPLLVPGVYQLSFERPGFTTLIRKDIFVSVDFAAELNVTLDVATVADTIVVAGDTPLIDTQNTTIQSSFTSETLKALPSARDLMSVIGLLPATIMSLHDVGGSTAGTQPVYLTYGQFSVRQFQSRVQLDGINTTDGGVAGLYFDYGAFDEVRLGTSSNDASMPNPGLQVNAVLKSGGNQLKGDVYIDFGDDALQADNVDERQRRQGIGRGTRIRRYYDPNVNIGGPIKRDTLWFFTSVRNQHLRTVVAGFPVEDPGQGPDALMLLRNLTYKLTYQPRPRSRLSHSLQFGRRYEPYRDAGSTNSRDAVAEQDSLSWAGNLEWQAIINPAFIMTTRVSTFGSDVRVEAYGMDGEVGVNVAHRRFEFVSGNSAGGAESSNIGRDRRQLEWTGTLFQDDWRGVNHHIRMGALTEWETTDTDWAGHKESLRLRFQSRAMPEFSVPFQVQLYNHPLASSDRLWHHGAFVQDQIALGPRWTLNIGVRWDSYSAYYPNQRVRDAPFTHFFYRGQPLPNGYSIPPAPFGDIVPALHDIIQYRKAFGPRVGAAWKIAEGGNTVLKASWGRYFSDPGTTISRDVNPLQTTSYIFTWNDGNADRVFQPAELGSFVSSTGGVLNGIARDIQHPYTDNMDVWMEHRFGSNLSGRLGYVYKKANNNWELIEKSRLGALFTEAKQFHDPGPDGVQGTSDDRGSYTAFDIPPAIPLPPSVKEWQSPGDFDEIFKSIAIALDKRMSDRWSLSTSFVNTWVHRLSNGHPDNPNEAINNIVRVASWTFKAFGTYLAPRGIRLSPIVRQQAGQPLGRFRLTDLRAGVSSIALEPAGTYHGDSRTIFDTRLEKQFRLGRASTFRVFVDAYNIFNSNAAQAHDVFTGDPRTTVVDGERIEYQRFLRPLTILPPRMYRVGLNLTF